MTIHTNDMTREIMGASTTYDGFYANAMGIPGAILSFSLFIAAKQLESRIASLRLYPRIRELSTLSLGIYAIHIQVLNAINYYLLDYVWFSIIIRAIVVYLLTAIFVWLYRLAKKKTKSLILSTRTDSARKGL